VVLVYDFATHSEDGTAGEALTEDRERAIATAHSLSEQTVEKLREKGIHAERASGGTDPPLYAFLVKGQFVTIDAGSRIKRMVIGFGAGASELEVRVQVYQQTAAGPRRIAEAEVDAHGSRKPGMAVPIAGGAAAGSAAVSAAVSGGMTLVTEKRGGMDRDAGNLAKQIAERAETFWKEQGWL
jgi:hypothetical protein